MKRILVIGSVHLDIIADYSASTSKNIDKIGKLTYSVGGVGFNIVSNLVLHHSPDVIFYSYLNPSSLSGHLISGQLKARGIRTDYIHRSNDLPESGFVAQLEEGKLKSAVSCVGMEFVQLDLKSLDSAIHSADVILVDCNLSQPQLQQVVNAVTKHKEKLLFVTCVSESKVDRIVKTTLPTSSQIEAAFMNMAEARRVYPNIGNESAETTAHSICEIMHSKAVFVTNGKAGFTVYYRDGTNETHSSVALPQREVVNEIGAGDALCAAALAFASETSATGHPWGSAKSKIDAFVVKVLRTKPSSLTAASSLSFRFGAHILAGCSFIFSLCMFLLVLLLGGREIYFVSFVLVPVFAGICGANATLLLEQESRAVKSSRSASTATILGGIAGFITAMLFSLSQKVSNADSLGVELQTINSELVWQIPFIFIFAFIGGLTLDSVLQKLRDSDVLKTKILKD